MTGFTVLSETLILSTALGLMALAFFALATWSGRWPLWLAGWVCVALALAVALFLHVRRPARGPAPPPPGATTVVMDAGPERIDYNGPVGPGRGATSPPSRSTLDAAPSDA